MSPPPHPTYITILHRAINSPHGIIVSAPNAEEARNKLYLARTFAVKSTPALAQLQFRIISEQEMWIIKVG